MGWQNIIREFSRVRGIYNIQLTTHTSKTACARGKTLRKRDSDVWLILIVAISIEACVDIDSIPCN